MRTTHRLIRVQALQLCTCACLTACQTDLTTHHRSQAPAQPVGTSPAVPPPSAASGPMPDSEAHAPVIATEASDASTPQRAMDDFLAALRTKNADLLLGCFSKKRVFGLTSTGQGKPQRSRFTYSQLAGGIAPGGDFVGVMFGEDGLDSVYYYATEGNENGPWLLRSSATFVPSLYVPSPGESALVSVSWVKEGKRYVINEIAFPF
jgi:hypothetical protein